MNTETEVTTTETTISKRAGRPPTFNFPAPGSNWTVSSVLQSLGDNKVTAAAVDTRVKKLIGAGKVKFVEHESKTGKGRKSAVYTSVA